MLGFLLAATGSTAFSLNTLAAKGEDSSPLLVAEIFEPSKIAVETMSQDKNLVSFDLGVALTSSNAEHTLELKNEYAGDFSFVYLPNKAGSNYEAGTLEIMFTDVTDGDSFAIVVEHAATMNAYVRFEDINAGLFYVEKNLLDYTSFCNEDDLYTRFSAKKVGVRFDPSTMCVYVGNTEEALSLVWDLSKELNDGRNVGKTLDPFASYRVSFRMSSFFVNSGSLVLYEVNGCPLDSLLVNESGIPSIFADFEKNALVGEEYTLPEGIGYDIVDGALDTKSAVYDPNGNAVTVISGKFTPSTAGEYTVVYTATNSSGKEVVKEYALTAYEAAPANVAELDWTLNDEYVLNEQVYVPELLLSGGIRRYGKELGTLTIEKDGEVFEGFENKTSGFDFTFTEAGEYAFVYQVSGEEVRYNVLVNGAENRFVAAGLQGKYAKNEIIDCRESYVLIGGEKPEFDFTVKFPSGKRYTNRKFQVTEVGRYALNAIATVGEKTYSFEKFFTVSENFTDYFTPMHGTSVENGIGSFTRKEGVVVTSTNSGSLVEYALPINISKYVNQREVAYDENGEITGIRIAETATPLIELTVDPEKYGVRAAEDVYIYLTDAADPNNKITISARTRNQYAAITAAATGQSLKGFNPNTKGTLTIDGYRGDLNAYGSGGYRLWHPFAGNTRLDLNYIYKPQDSLIALYYDNEAKQLLGRVYSDTNNTAKYQVILDFDDIRYLNSDLPWDGFKSDYVYLSFSINNLAGERATACVYSVDGRSFGTIEENAPTIHVDSEETLEGLKDYSLAVPEATAKDCYSNAVKVASKVYYEKDGRRFDVSVQKGRFNTAQSGDYYIVYTATDAFGRSSEKEIAVKVEETYEALAATLDDPTAEYTSGKIADKITLVSAENAEVVGAIGKVESVCKVYLGEEEIAVEGESFVPQKAGAYKVEYTFTDAVGRTTNVSYNVEIEVPEELVVTSALPMYVGFVRGNTYEIADVYFIDYTKADITEQKADVYINGEKLAGTQYALEDKIEEKDAEEAVESLRLEYRYGEKVIKGYDIPVKMVAKKVDVSVGMLVFESTKFLAERYFLTDENVSVLSQQTYTKLVSTKSGARVSFVQPLQSNNLSFALDIDQTKNEDLSPVETNIKSIKMHLTDATDLEKSLLVEIQSDTSTNKVRLCVNGEDYSAPFTGSLVGTVVDWIKLRFEDNYFVDATKGVKLLKPSHYENGEAFEGFTGSVYVDFAIEALDETKETAIRLQSINDQLLTSDLEWDSTKPNLFVENEFGGIYEQGIEVEISALNAYDVFSSVLSDSLKVSLVYLQNGQSKFAKDVNGVEMNGVSAKTSYRLILSETGAYTLIYTAEDCRGNVGEKRFAFEVIKHQDPVIELQGELPESVKAGTVVQVPPASASFLQENDKNVTWIVVISPSTNTYTLVNKDDPAFKATQLGDYLIRYCAIDAYGSYTIVEYVVTCYA